MVVELRWPGALIATGCICRLALGNARGAGAEHHRDPVASLATDHGSDGLGNLFQGRQHEAVVAGIKTCEVRRHCRQLGCHGSYVQTPVRHEIVALHDAVTTSGKQCACNRGLADPDGCRNPQTGQSHGSRHLGVISFDCASISYPQAKLEYCSVPSHLAPLGQPYFAIKTMSLPQRTLRDFAVASNVQPAGASAL